MTNESVEKKEVRRYMREIEREVMSNARTATFLSVSQLARLEKLVIEYERLLNLLRDRKDDLP